MGPRHRRDSQGCSREEGPLFQKPRANLGGALWSQQHRLGQLGRSQKLYYTLRQGLHVSGELASPLTAECLVP